MLQMLFACFGWFRSSVYFAGKFVGRGTYLAVAGKKMRGQPKGRDSDFEAAHPRPPLKQHIDNQNNDISRTASFHRQFTSVSWQSIPVPGLP